jgi:DNA-binding transcriptional LysR family regulator
MAMLLENMEVFARVVEMGSLSAAGRHLRLSPAVVSHRLQQLENHLGVRLLNRTTRQVQPTEQGAAYYEACQEVLAAVAYADTIIADAGGTPRGNLRVTAPLGFGRRVLAPLVPAFIAKYPQLSVRLRLSDHLLDLARHSP